MYIVHVLYGLKIKEMEKEQREGLDQFPFDDFLRKTNSLANISGQFFSFPEQTKELDQVGKIKFFIL